MRGCCCPTRVCPAPCPRAGPRSPVRCPGAGMRASQTRVSLLWHRLGAKDPGRATPGPPQRRAAWGVYSPQNKWDPNSREAVSGRQPADSRRQGSAQEAEEHVRPDTGNRRKPTRAIHIHASQPLSRPPRTRGCWEEPPRGSGPPGRRQQPWDAEPALKSEDRHPNCPIHPQPGSSARRPDTQLAWEPAQVPGSPGSGNLWPHGRLSPSSGLPAETAPSSGWLPSHAGPPGTRRDTHLTLQEVPHFPEVLLVVVLQDDLAPSQPQLCVACLGDLWVRVSQFLHVPWERKTGCLL